MAPAVREGPPATGKPPYWKKEPNQGSTPVFPPFRCSTPGARGYERRKGPRERGVKQGKEEAEREKKVRKEKGETRMKAEEGQTRKGNGAR